MGSNKKRQLRMRLVVDANILVAEALAINAGIWTQDADFLGCGLPTWTTETLLGSLAEEVTAP